ncbi:type I-E CRISPR-associated protein Cas6/Cse3/CasE [Streptomyces sparsogenes]|uniref:type I-E CRISPR-associated protein Cas6/Cse3/CasE n=1 Tax=Streptomyces sparsogenes TaxID=67365 RepID=UPI00332D792F
MTTAYLARIRLNPFSRTVQRDLRDAAELHRTLMNLAPDGLGESARKQASLLFRLEEDERGSTLLVQAAVPIDLTGLPTGYGDGEVKDLSPMFKALRAGMPVRYRIAANPAKRERLPLENTGDPSQTSTSQHRKRGRILPLVGAEADQWWTRRAAAAGLEVRTLMPTPLGSAKGRTGDTGRKRTMRHQLIRYDGTATVTDPHALADAVINGIGRGKPYGAGLLSLAPAGTD